MEFLREKSFQAVCCAIGGRGKMPASKYGPLMARLDQIAGDGWEASFKEVEAVLGFALPESARKYQAWWSGGAGAKCWRQFGWKARDISLVNEKLVFIRGDAPPTASPVARSASVVPEFPVSGVPVETVIRMAWAELGRVSLDGGKKPVFPKSFKAPAIYRFSVRVAGQERRYVGEAVDLSRRFGNYRNPGPTQETSQRIHRIVVEALEVNGEVLVDAVFPGAARIGQIPADLSSKIVRCLFENAAILESGVGCVMLNAAD